jgi:steroid delta-isomerase-like uncharacterized protein
MGMHFFTAQDRLRGGPDPELCAPGYTAQVNGQAMDLAGHTQMAGAFYAAFPDLNHVIEDTVADDEKVAVRVVALGTHSAELMGIPASGKRVSIEIMAILWIEHGKVTELRVVFDQLGFLKQIGAA